MRSRFLVLVIGLLLTSLRTAAGEVLDQQYDCTGCGAADTASPFGQEVGQTFTVGISGTLTRIESQVVRIFGSGGTLIFNLYNTSGGLPNTNLGSRTLAWDQVPQTGFNFLSFDFSSLALPVQAGEVYAFSIRSSGETGFGLRSTFDTDTYAGGGSKWRSLGPPPGAWQSVAHDNGFRTYVTPSALPLPGDYNNNNVVDAADYVIWRKHLGEPSEAAISPHGDGQHGVDSGDYTLWRSKFGMSGGAATASALVPEPAVASLLFAGALALITARRRRK
jgi:hypothetical protein